MSDLQKFHDAQKSHKVLQGKKTEVEEMIKNYYDEKHDTLKVLQKEFNLQKRKNQQIKKHQCQIGLLAGLEEDITTKRELTSLREEEEFWRKEEEEDAILVRNREVEEGRKRNILEERDFQIRAKEELKLQQKENEEAYIAMLTKLQEEEEEYLHQRKEVRRQRMLQHIIASKHILEERRRRRKQLVQNMEEDLKQEKTLMKMRDSLLVEEERCLLLEYLPHLGPFLTAPVLEKLSSL